MQAAGLGENRKNAHTTAFLSPAAEQKKGPSKGPMVPVVGLEPTRMISPTDFELFEAKRRKILLPSFTGRERSSKKP